MNKKLALIGAGVLAGSVLLMSSVYAGIGQAPGYEAYKSAVKSTAAVENATVRINVTVEDNGKPLIEAHSTMKTDSGQRGSVDMTVSSGGETQRVQVFHADGKAIIKSSGSDVYRILEASGEERDWSNRGEGDDPTHDAAFAAEAEKILDALVGNLKNDVVLKEAGDGKEISAQLEGSRIPSIVNAVGSLAIREGGRDHGAEPASAPADPFGLNFRSLKQCLPKLTQDIRIDAVHLRADVDADNRITNQTVEIRISGKDAQGVDHLVVVNLGMGFSDFNGTVPDAVDLTGKPTEIVEPSAERFDGWHKR
ncbi:hypothetical protein ACF3MZ_29900 [Paenibacillaceae bacterium WGS1546]|uniref:hypothetical protein n=1 Tax=Cohnella sp. WGS1546 TaxID=3366810 RepID=UPI00372D7D6A